MNTEAIRACPADCKVFPLRPNQKEPGNEHGHLQATPIGETKIGGNYGISLDDQFLVVDIDDISKVSKEMLAQIAESPTWCQSTRRGHHYLYTVPKGFKGTNSKPPGMDVKVNGYVVGPYSVVSKDRQGNALEPVTYTMMNKLPAQPAPMWALNLVTKNVKTQAKETEGFVNIDDVANESTEDEITDRTRLCSRIRKMIDAGFEPSEAAGMVFKSQEEICKFWNASDPFTLADLQKMASDWSGKGPVEEVNAKRRFIYAPELDFSICNYEEFIEGLLIRGRFTSFYGDSGINKTGIGAFMLAKLSRMGFNVAFIGSEDGAQDFSKRFIASDGVFTKLYCFDIEAKHIILDKKHERELVQDIKQSDFSCVMFDSIMDHRPVAGQNDNAADIARTWAGAAARVALATNCAIIGITHEAAAGNQEGGVQQKAKARLVAHFTKDGKNAVNIKVTKTNSGLAGQEFTAPGATVPSINPITGEKDHKTIWADDGTKHVEDLTVYICTAINRKVVEPETPEMKAESKHTENVGKVVAWFKANPGDHTLSRIKTAGVLGRDQYAKTLTDPQFIKLEEKIAGSDVYRLAYDSVSLENMEG